MTAKKTLRPSIESYELNLKVQTQPALQALHALDKTFIGTSNYMGLTYFWNYEYRHVMRQASIYECRVVHQRMLKAGLKPDGKSPEHADIVDWVEKRLYR